MKVTGWILLASSFFSVAATVALMVRAFYRLLAAGGAAGPMELAGGIRLALIPTWIGLGLFICGLTLLFIGYRANRRRTPGFPMEAAARKLEP